MFVGATISAFGLSALIIGACVFMRQFNYLITLALGVLAIGLACLSIFFYRTLDSVYMGMASSAFLMLSFLLIHVAMASYLGRMRDHALEWSVLCAIVIFSGVYLLGYEGLSFVLCFVVTACLILYTTTLYWEHRFEVPYLMHGFVMLGITTASLMLTRAGALIAYGQYAGNPPMDSWAEDLTAVSAVCLVTGFGPMIVALHHVRDRIALISDAVTDPLTGLRNRRALHELFGKKAFSPDMAVVMFDLDHFKRTNDVFGHQVGDDVLQRFANIASQCVAADASAFRLGGEEFAMVIERGGAKRAHDLASRIVTAFASEIVMTPLGPLRSTVSGGVASGSATNRNLEQVLATADAALYEAKRGGRNRIWHAEQGLPEGAPGGRKDGRAAA